MFRRETARPFPFSIATVFASLDPPQHPTLPPGGGGKKTTKKKKRLRSKLKRGYAAMIFRLCQGWVGGKKKKQAREVFVGSKELDWGLHR